MHRTVAITATLAAVCAIASLQAFAGTTDPGESAEAAATRRAVISPTRAIALAEKGGGTVYGFGMESERSGHWYEVDILRHGTPTIVRIDSASGRVLGTSRARGEDATGAHALDGSALQLGAAVAAAERKAKGPAMEATPVGAGTTAAVIVDIAGAQGMEHYRVSMENGKLRIVKIARDPTDA